MLRRCVVSCIAATAMLGLSSLTIGAPQAFAAPSATHLTHRHVRSCAAPPAGQAACNAVLNETVTAAGRVVKPAAVGGYGPANLTTAYQLPSAAAGSGQTVAVIDAYNDPSAASDLATYRSHFGLPACTTATACLRIVSQTGGTRLPEANGGWAQEISVDLDVVSATCPNCHILLVEATNPSQTDLGAAVNEAARLGATEISNSYGASESTADASYDAIYYDHPGIAITASTGDSGYGVEYPAASRYVTATGGTTLTDTGGVYSQTAWGDAGSGCSADDAQPSWQTSVAAIAASCARRAVADVSADADPNTGVAVYDSDAYQGASGWLVFGGTSVASPLIASVYALADNYTGTGASSVYSRAASGGVTDVTSGSNGSCGTALCNAGAGWDGPTGLGTPDGDSAF